MFSPKDKADLELYEFVWLEGFQCTAGRLFWNNGIKYVATPSSTHPGSENAPDIFRVTDESIALFLVIFESNARRWTNWDKGIKDNNAPTHLQLRTERRYQTKYSQAFVGQHKFGGFSPDGLNRFDELTDLVKALRGKTAKKASNGTISFPNEDKMLSRIQNKYKGKVDTLAKKMKSAKKTPPAEFQEQSRRIKKKDKSRGMSDLDRLMQHLELNEEEDSSESEEENQAHHRGHDGGRGQVYDANDDDDSSEDDSDSQPEESKSKHPSRRSGYKPPSRSRGCHSSSRAHSSSGSSSEEEDDTPTHKDEAPSRQQHHKDEAPSRQQHHGGSSSTEEDEGDEDDGDSDFETEKAKTKAARKKAARVRGNPCETTKTNTANETTKTNTAKAAPPQAETTKASQQTRPSAAEQRKKKKGEEAAAKKAEAAARKAEAAARKASMMAAAAEKRAAAARAQDALGNADSDSVSEEVVASVVNEMDIEPLMGETAVQVEMDAETAAALMMERSLN